MFSLFYGILLAPITFLIAHFVYLRMQKPAEYWQLSSQMPSITKTFWTEMKVSWELATKQPKEMLAYLTNMFEENGPVVHLYLSGRSYVFMNDPDDLKTLLTSGQYIDKGPEYEMLQPWLNDGLLISTGSKWQSRRKLLTNTFHFKTLTMYVPSLNKNSRVLSKKLLEASTKKKFVSVIEYVTLCSLDMICETIMGTEMNAQEGESVEYVQSINSACRSVIDRVFKFWLWNDMIFRISECGRIFYKSVKVIHSFTKNVIKKKRTLFNELKNQTGLSDSTNVKYRAKSFLDLLLNTLESHPDQMTDKEIQAEVDTFLFEGHDTSSISMTMTILLLGIHQDIQEKAREELFSIFGDSDRDATLEDLNAMTYLDAIIKESLRLFPSVPAFTRELNTPLKLKNYTIPPLTTITVYTYILHRTKEIYPEPEKFIPERFLDDSNKAKFLFGYLPFSAGARNCIGQKYAMNQMKTVVSTILRTSKFETLGTMEDIIVSPQLILRVESVPNVKFYKI